MIWVIRVLGFIASAVASVITLHLGTQATLRLLGKNKCLPYETLVGCDWWVYSTIFSTALVIGASRLGWIALSFVPIVPIVFLGIATLRLRFGELKARKRDFEVVGNQVLELRTKREIQPGYVESRSAYYQTGVGSGYCLYKIIIHLSDGSSLSNGYISEEERTKDYEALVGRLGALAFDLMVVDRPAENRFRTVTFGQEWTPLLCGTLASLSESKISDGGNAVFDHDQ